MLPWDATWHVHCNCARKRPRTSPSAPLTSQTGSVTPRVALRQYQFQTRSVGYVGVMQHKQARGDQLISSLPDALLTHILKLADHETRLLAHLVCQRWNRILRQPTCPDLWEPLPVLHLFKYKLTRTGTAQLSRGMAWLATRAAGIALAQFCFPGQCMIDTHDPGEVDESPV